MGLVPEKQLKLNDLLGIVKCLTEGEAKKMPLENTLDFLFLLVPFNGID